MPKYDFFEIWEFSQNFQKTVKIAKYGLFTTFVTNNKFIKKITIFTNPQREYNISSNGLLAHY